MKGPGLITVVLANYAGTRHGECRASHIVAAGDLRGADLTLRDADPMRHRS